MSTETGIRMNDASDWHSANETDQPLLDGQLDMSSEIGNRTNYFVSNYFSGNEMDQLLRVVKEGDALEFQRMGYFHWGIFVGNIEIGVEGVEGNVAKMYAKQLQNNLELKWEIDEIEKTNEVNSIKITNGVVHVISEKISRSSSNSHNGVLPHLGLLLNTNGGYVDCTELQYILDKSQVRINNEIAEKHAVYEPREIISNAIKSIGKYKYNLFFNNCEHFVNYCIVGKKISKQVEIASALEKLGLQICK